MTSTWVTECAHAAALISETRDGCCHRRAPVAPVRLSSECTRIDDIISKLQNPTEHVQCEAVFLAAQQRQQRLEQSESTWPSWLYAASGLGAGFVSPAVDNHDWEDAVARWARSVSDVQAEVDELLILTQLANVRAETEQTMAAEQSERTEAQARAPGGGGGVGDGGGM